MLTKTDKQTYSEYAFRNVINKSLYALVTHQVQQHPAPERETASTAFDFSAMRHYG